MAVSVVVVVSSIELLVCKESLCLLCMLLLIYCDGRLKFVDKSFKAVWQIRNCISVCWYSLIRSDNFIVEKIYGLQDRPEAML